MDFFNNEQTVTEIVASVFVPEGQGTPVHKNRHSHGLAFCVNSRGSVYTFSNGEALVCKSGDCIFLPQGSCYTVSSSEANFERSMHSEKCGVYAINFKISEEYTYHPLVVKINGLDRALSNFTVAENAWRKKATVYREDCIIALYKIIRQIKRERNEGVRKLNGILFPALEYISTHYTDENISIPHLSELCGVSEPYLRRLFRAEFGCSPAIYVRRLRLQYARSLLETKEYSITDVAMLSGFNSPAYFSREFKKEYEASPKVFLKM